MVNAKKDYLTSFFSGNLRFIVPFFQRPYVWDIENWDILWEHVNELVEDPNKSEHFIGTLITKERVSESIDEKKVDLIDGQQRLTSFAILLKAIATKATGDAPYSKLKDKANELVVFENAKEEKFIRIEHSKNDKPYFETIILDKDIKSLLNPKHKILSCYNYFVKKLENYTDEQLDILKNIVLNKVPVISMLLSVEDDEQEIFDTINSLGVKLTTGELLKNFIFSEDKLKDHYNEYWEVVFEDDEDQIKFWDKEKTSGRIKRTNIEVFLYCYLIIKTGEEVKLETLFKEYKKWLRDKSISETILMLKELKTYAELYEAFPQGEVLNEISFSENEKRFFHIIQYLEITTVLPLVLYIYKRINDSHERNAVLKVLESYLVRRNICRLTTKNYNNLFIEILKKLKDLPSFTAQDFSKILLTFDKDTNIFPSDASVMFAVSNESISNANAREILYCISLFKIDNPLSDVRKLSVGSFSTEHMMPVKWATHWNSPVLGENDKAIRNKKIKTLGNLTLVTGSLNSTLKNNPWSKKKSVLKSNSKLAITSDYLMNDNWDEVLIEARAKDLAAEIIKVWKR